MYNGEKWVSDFVQRRFWPNTAYENDYKREKKKKEKLILKYSDGKDLLFYFSVFIVVFLQ